MSRGKAATAKLDEEIAEALSHRYTMKDGTVVTTTWHESRVAANRRIKKPAVATFRKVFHEPRSALGPYRAVTWE